MRKLDSREVPQEDLEKLIMQLIKHPRVPTIKMRWIIVRDQEVKKLAEPTEPAESYLAPMIESPGSLSHQPEDKRRRMLEAVVWQKEHMHEILALVIACIDLGTTTPTNDCGRQRFYMARIQNLLLPQELSNWALHRLLWLSEIETKRQKS